MRINYPYLTNYICIDELGPPSLSSCPCQRRVHAGISVPEAGRCCRGHDFRQSACVSGGRRRIREVCVQCRVCRHLLLIRDILASWAARVTDILPAGPVDDVLRLLCHYVVIPLTVLHLYGKITNIMKDNA